MSSPKRIPIVATIVVLAAVGVMVWLGFWQLDRMGQKEALLTRYTQAQTMSSDVPWPADDAAAQLVLYRHARITCDRVTGLRAIAGRSASDESGWAHMATCELQGGGTAEVALGWSRDPADRVWNGGEVGGIIGPAGTGAKLVASPPLAGLEQLTAPDPNDIPNNHLAYAGQWFFFALTALVIYVLALRRRWVAPK
jgi:surfeit locus 1 family protein